MKEHPIIFSTPMVQAILEGRKIMTRRVIKPQPLNSYLPDSDIIKRLKSIPQHTRKLRDKDNPAFIHIIPKSPYGQVGDRLWVRETWGALEEFSALRIKYMPHDMPIYFKAEDLPVDIAWKPSIFMPRWASRITLEITEVRVERVRDISHADAILEGAKCFPVASPREERLSGAQIVFAGSWDTINAKRGYGWEVNPWVWVISFTRG